MSNLRTWLVRFAVVLVALACVAVGLHIVQLVAARLSMNTISAVAGWLLSEERVHKEILMVFSLAVIACLPEELPFPFNKVAALVWLWQIFVRSLKLFVSMTHPNFTQQHTEQESPDGKRTVTDKTSIPMAPSKEPITPPAP